MKHLLLSAWRRKCTGLLTLFLLGYVSAVAAHHSYLAVFNPEDPVSVTGKVTRVRWTNPHAAFYVEAKKPDGTVEQWEFELHSPNSMMRGGWNRDSVKVGDVVTVKGARARANPHLAFVSVAVFPDGREVFGFGSDPED